MSHSNAGRYGIPGSSPITPAGRVVYNGVRDILEIEERKRRLAAGNSAIGGKSDDDVFVMQRWNPVMVLKVKHADSELTTEMIITDCANGFGNKGEKRWQLNAKLRPGGFIGTDADYDSKAGDDIQGNHAPVQLGGLANVPNWGPKEIKAGQIVLLSAPDPRNPKPVQSRHDHPKGKIHWWTLPYDPRDQATTKEAAYDIIKHMLRKKANRLPDTNRKKTQSKILSSNNTNLHNLVEFSTDLFSAIRTIAMAGVVAWIESGLVVPSSNLANVEDIKEASTEWREGTNQQSRNNILEALGGYFGINEKNNFNSNAIQVPKRPSNTGTHSMVELLTELVFSSRNYKVFAEERIGEAKGVFGGRGTINREFGDVMEKLLASVASAN